MTDRIIQMLGAAPNIAAMPIDPGPERWVCNNPYLYRVKYTPAFQIWTHWFNLHSTEHMRTKYLHGYRWFQKQDGTRPIYLRDADPTIPGSQAFPGLTLQEYWSLDGTPFRFITCSIAWLLAFAGYQHLHGDPARIELWGFELRRDQQWAYERPCVAYWLKRLRDLGIDVFLPPGVDVGPPGDPMIYTGPLYGYETTEPIAAPLAVEGLSHVA